MAAELSEIYREISQCQTLCSVNKGKMVNMVSATGYCHPKNWNIPWYSYTKNIGKLMLIGQDFGNQSTVSCYQSNDNNVKDATFARLENLLKNAGLEEKTYLWNVIMCVRPGDHKEVGYLPEGIRKNCTRQYLDSIISQVQPQIVGALGKYALEGILEIYSNDEISLEKPYWDIIDSFNSSAKTHNGRHCFKIIALPHPGMPLKGWTNERKLSAYREVASQLS